MSIFDIDYSSAGLPKYLSPVSLRNSMMLSWLGVLVCPVTYLYGLFSQNRWNNIYWLSHGGQVCYLEAVLNDMFDMVGRGIYIADGPYVDPDFIYEVVENKPLFIDLVSEIGTSVIPDPDPLPLYTTMETYWSGVQFVINVPVAVATSAGYDLHRLKALVNKYRLAGKNNYSVVTY